MKKILTVFFCIPFIAIILVSGCENLVDDVTTIEQADGSIPEPIEPSQVVLNNAQPAMDAIAPAMSAAEKAMKKAASVGQTAFSDNSVSGIVTRGTIDMDSGEMSFSITFTGYIYEGITLYGTASQNAAMVMNGSEIVFMAIEIDTNLRFINAQIDTLEANYTMTLNRTDLETSPEVTGTITIDGTIYNAATFVDSKTGDEAPSQNIIDALNNTLGSIQDAHTALSNSIIAAMNNGETSFLDSRLQGASISGTITKIGTSIYLDTEIIFTNHVEYGVTVNGTYEFNLDLDHDRNPVLATQIFNLTFTNAEISTLSANIVTGESGFISGSISIDGVAYDPALIY